MRQSVEFYVLDESRQVLPSKRWVSKPLSGWRAWVQYLAFRVLDLLGSYDWNSNTVWKNTLTTTDNFSEAVRVQLDDLHRRGMSEREYTILCGPDVYTELLRHPDRQFFHTDVELDNLPLRISSSQYVDRSFLEQRPDIALEMARLGYAMHRESYCPGSVKFEKMWGMKIRMLPHMKGLLLLPDQS